MSVTISIQNAHQNGAMVDGDIVVQANLPLGVNINHTEHFSTNGHSSYSFGAAGCTVTLQVDLVPPNQVCASGQVQPPFGSAITIGQQCVAV